MSGRDFTTSSTIIETFPCSKNSPVQGQERGNPFVPRRHELPKIEYIPAKPSENAMKGILALVPVFGSSFIESFRIPGTATAKYGPLSDSIDFISKHATLSPPVVDALQRAWACSPISHLISLEDHIERIGEAKGYENYESREFAVNLAYRIRASKYKPVAKKVVPVSTHDPQSTVPAYAPIEIGPLPPLPTHPVKLEELTYTDKLTRERIETITGNIPNEFFSKDELELLL